MKENKIEKNCRPLQVVEYVKENGVLVSKKTLWSWGSSAAPYKQNACGFFDGLFASIQHFGCGRKAPRYWNTPCTKSLDGWCAWTRGWHEGSGKFWAIETKSGKILKF